MATSEVESIAVPMSEISLEDVAARHRREKKELQAKIQELKKSAPKNDKKRRKEATETIIRLEKELEERHKIEIKDAEDNNINTTEIPPTSAISNAKENEEISSSQRVSKAQKRRDKKAKEAKQREEDIRAAAEDAIDAPKATEARQLDALLKERQLSSFTVPSDGDCLYNAVKHQLGLHGLGDYSVKQLREETANYIKANKDNLICYMTHPQTGNLLNDEEFEKYCTAVANTPAWGGQIELKALSSILKVPIEVLQSSGPPTIQGDGEFAGPNLTITYHRHMYSLGAHYDSTKPLEEEAEDNTE